MYNVLLANTPRIIATSIPVSIRKLAVVSPCLNMPFSTTVTTKPIRTPTDTSNRWWAWKYILPKEASGAINNHKAFPESKKADAAKTAAPAASPEGKLACAVLFLFSPVWSCRNSLRTSLARGGLYTGETRKRLGCYFHCAAQHLPQFLLKCNSWSRP